RKPWNCTICTFASYSPFKTYQHIMKEHIEDNTGNNSLEGSGYTCPFCRRCTYGYKTLSGFKRHMMCPPIEHCHLKRVFEISREMCRSQQLEPVNQWASWSEDNVALAYYGFIPPKKAMLAKRRSETVPNSPAKPLLKVVVRPDSTSPRKEVASVQRMERTAPIQTARLVGASESRLPFEGIRFLHPPSVPVQSSHLHYSANSSQTLADVLAGVGRGGASAMGEDSAGHSMAEVVNEPLDPAYLRKWMTTTDIRVSKRQIEAAQARARLFGDALGPGDIPLPIPSRTDSFRNSHQRLINVDKDLTADLSSRRPLFSPVSTVTGRPRVNILRPKHAPP
ncbi:hypothetical protein PFISCL1PPCAC_28864, partial [Pristionchus fissidentatus]